MNCRKQLLFAPSMKMISFGLILSRAKYAREPRHSTSSTMTETKQDAASATSGRTGPQLGWRLPVAIVFFLLAIASLLIGAALLAGHASVRVKSVAALMVFPTPEILDVTAIAILGKPGFEWFKSKIFGFLRRHGPPAEVSRTRYNAGLVLLVLPLVAAWLGPYFAHLIPGYEDHRLVWHVAFDLMFVASFFVLGGDFWDKVRSLFIHGAKAPQ